MRYHATLPLLAAAGYLPSALGCIFFNATLHNGAKTAQSAEQANEVLNQDAKSIARDQRLDLSLWDDSNNDQTVDALKDAFCHGVDLKPYEDNSWTVPCEPEEKGVELDVHWDPEITEGGMLISTLKYNNKRAQAEKFNDPKVDLPYTFQAKSKDQKGEFFEAKIFCGDCSNSAGQDVKC